MTRPTRSRTFAAALAACLGGLVLTADRAPAQTPGDLRALTVEKGKGPDGKLRVRPHVPADTDDGDGKWVVRLRFCPAGKALLLKDEVKNEADDKVFAEKMMSAEAVYSVDVAPFWICDAETSQGLYLAVLEANPRLWSERKLRSDREVYKACIEDEKLGGGKTFYRPDLPMFGLSGREAATFCQALGDLFAKSSNGFVKYQVRLPDSMQWQYACRARAGADEEARSCLHYHCKKPWRMPSMPEESPKLLNEIWMRVRADFGRPEPHFPETQDGVILMTAWLEWKKAEAIKERKDFQQLHFPVIWKSLVGEERTFDRRKSGLTTTPAELVPSRANDWSIHDMLGNVAEWTVGGGDDWKKLVSDGVPEHYLLAGGGTNREFSGGDWRRFTIWGAERVKKVLADDNPGLSRFEQMMAGVRFVVTIEPEADFVAKLRAGADGDREQLKAVLTALGETKGVTLDSASARLRDFYEGIVRYKLADPGVPGTLQFTRLPDPKGAETDEGVLLETLEYLGRSRAKK